MKEGFEQTLLRRKVNRRGGIWCSKEKIEFFLESNESETLKREGGRIQLQKRLMRYFGYQTFLQGCMACRKKSLPHQERRDF